MRFDGAPPPSRPRYGPAPRRAAQLPAPAVNSLGIPIVKCEFCNSPIVWVREVDNPNAYTPEGKTGKLIPIDPEPSTDIRATLALSPPAGKDFLGRELPQHRAGEMRPGQAAGYREAGKQTWLRHVKSCANADDMRRGIKARRTRRR